MFIDYRLGRGIKLNRNFDLVKQDKISINACSTHSKEDEIISIKEQTEQTYLKSQDKNIIDISPKMLTNKSIKQKECQGCAASNTKIMQLEKMIKDLKCQIDRL